MPMPRSSLVAIAEILKRYIFFIISHADHPLRNPADFAGKTVGILSDGGAKENLLDMMLAATAFRRQGAASGVGNAPGAFEFVKQGRIAGFIATSDTVFQLQTDKQPIVAWSTDHAAPCPGQVYMTSGEPSRRMPTSSRASFAPWRLHRCHACSRR